MNEAEMEAALLWLMGCATEIVNIWSAPVLDHETMNEQVGLLEQALKPFKKEGA
jgi:hypothetical protein